MSISAPEKAEALYLEIIDREDPDVLLLANALRFFLEKGKFELVKKVYGENVLWLQAFYNTYHIGDFYQILTPDDFHKEEYNNEWKSWLKRELNSNCVLNYGPFLCPPKGELNEKYFENAVFYQNLLLQNYQNKKVIDWAKEEIRRMKRERVDIYEDDWIVPIKILIATPDEENRGEVDKFACGSVVEREMIAGFLGDVDTPSSKRMMREMMSIPQKAEVREQLLDSAIRFAAKDFARLEGKDRDLVKEYARADGPIPLEDGIEAKLPCVANYN